MKYSFRSAVRRSVLSSLALVALIAPAFCTTWIVDVNNGPGTNFTNIPAAIAAAAPGDVLIVRAGTYSNFVLSRGLTIIGQGVVKTSAAGGILVSGVPAGEKAVLINVEPTTAVSQEIRVTNCAGLVLLQSLDSPIVVVSSPDVRIFNTTSGNSIATSSPVAGLTVLNSRVQVVQSACVGRPGIDGNCCCADGTNGGAGIKCDGSSRLHLALSNAIGGEGGSEGLSCPPFSSTFPGSGGSGFVANLLAEVILTGGGFSTAQIVAGHMGGHYQHIFSPTLHLTGGANAWSSAVTFAPTPPLVCSTCSFVASPILEPALELIGTPSPGASITLRLRGEPGCNAEINVGRTPIYEVTPGVLVERKMLTELKRSLGAIPPSGTIDIPWSYRNGVRHGHMLIFQARVVESGSGAVHRSNSIEAVVQ